MVKDTTDWFPYIDSIHVNDCFASKDFDIPVKREGEGFSHLILTGRNGSGKTTVLKGVSRFYDVVLGQKLAKRIEGALNTFTLLGSLFPRDRGFVDLTFSRIVRGVVGRRSEFVNAFFRATRIPELAQVKSPTKSDSVEVILMSSVEQFAPNFKQFLVNKKVAQAFSQIDGKHVVVEETNAFFQLIGKTFGEIFEDKEVEIEFDNNSYEFYIVLGDGRKMTFEQLPDGYSAFIWILMDLMGRVDAIRIAQKNNSIDPPGTVLIDEPELHLHLELQYHVLPILTTLFPNIQFIVATHSPAVISSIRNATVFDLTTKEVAPSSTPGAAFSELMQTHFGLENEYGPVADAFLDKVKLLLKQPNKADAELQLKKLMEENDDVLTPTLRLELQSTLIRLRNAPTKV